MTKEQWIKVAKGFGIALAGSALTYLSTTVIPALEGSESATILILVPFLSTAVNVLRKLVESWKTPKEPEQ